MKKKKQQRISARMRFALGSIFLKEREREKKCEPLDGMSMVLGNALPFIAGVI